MQCGGRERSREWSHGRTLRAALWAVDMLTSQLAKDGHGSKRSNRTGVLWKVGAGGWEVDALLWLRGSGIWGDPHTWGDVQEDSGAVI